MAKSKKPAPRAAKRKSARPAPGAAKKTETAPPASPSATSAGWRVRIRMYRQGIGDCFLLTFPRKTGAEFHMLIDCGVHQAQKGGAETMKKIVADVAAATKGTIDLLALTHEHYDHTSGFVQARDEWENIAVKEVWYAWTENPEEDIAKRLGEKRHKIVEALHGLVARARLAAIPSPRIDRVESILGFFGDKGGAKTMDIRAAIDALCKNVAFRSPGECVPVEGIDACFYVLGPPKDTDRLKKEDPTSSAPETYGLDRLDSGLALTETLAPDKLSPPFDDRFRIPLQASRAVEFFRGRYWAESAAGAPDDPAPDDGNGREEFAQTWRRVDDDWLGAAEQFALQLDSATNNTSLVLAIELPGGDVLLFAADAQVGNWLSWQDVTFAVGGKTVTGPDLLKRTIFYKVGHHGSRNATLKEKGVDQMDRLEVAMMPTDDKTAGSVKWKDFPWPKLQTALEEKTHQRLVRSDAPVPASLRGEGKGKVSDKNELYYEIEF